MEPYLLADLLLTQFDDVVALAVVFFQKIYEFIQVKSI